MTLTDMPIVNAARGLRTRSNDGWRNASPTVRTRIQVALFVGVVLVAYHYSLSTLMQSLSVDTPLAYLGLVPIIALGLAAIRSRPSAVELAIHDRQVDFIVGVPLMVAALAINVFLPSKLSAMFWVWRIDLLSFPLFVAGVAALIFGIRALWRQRLAIGYLLLVWPVPYSVLLLRDLNAMTSLTLSGLRALLHVVHFAVPIQSSDGSVFYVVHAGRSFTISVVSACSGVNGMVGFLLVGIAFAAIVTGPRLRKAAWLAGGLFLLWVINLLRILLIFWAGQHFGEHFALKVLHPFVGLVTFNIGIIIMMLMLKPVGLQIGSGLGRWRTPREDPAPQVQPRMRLAVPSISLALALVCLFGLVLGVTNSKLRAYDLVAQATGEPKLVSYLSNPATPAGWGSTFATEYDWAKPFFGESSQWYRYVYSPTFGGDLRSSLPITADVINTNNLSSFSAYGVEACYRFHGYKLRDEIQVNLGGGITGQALSYSTSKGEQDWSIVYWIWPVKTATSTRYERVILYMLNDVNGSLGSTISVSPSLRGSLGASQSGLLATRGFLVAFAREIVVGQAKITPGAAPKLSNTVAAVDTPLRRRLQKSAGTANGPSAP